MKTKTENCGIFRDKTLHKLREFPFHGFLGANYLPVEHELCDPLALTLSQRFEGSGVCMSLVLGPVRLP